MKTFNFNKNHHYLFSDGVVRKPVIGFSNPGTFNVGRILAYNDRGVPPNMGSNFPYIVLCVEDFYTWPFHAQLGKLLPECVFDFNGKKYRFWYNKDKTGFGFVDGPSDILDSSQPGEEPVASPKVIEHVKNLLTGTNEKKDKLKKDYEELMAKAREIEKEIEGM